MPANGTDILPEQPAELLFRLEAEATEGGGSAARVVRFAGAQLGHPGVADAAEIGRLRTAEPQRQPRQHRDDDTKTRHDENRSGHCVHEHSDRPEGCGRQDR